MRKIFTLTTLLALLAGSTFAYIPKEPKEKKEKAPKEKKEKKEKPVDTSKEEKKKLKEEEKAIKDELKAYMKNPESYKARIDNFKTTIDSNEAQLGRMKSEVESARSKESEMSGKLASEDESLKKLEEENAGLKTKVSQQAESGADVASSTPGTVYKVQLGMYRGFNMNKYFDKPRSFGYEVVEGMNRYVIGSFPDEQGAKGFVADMRRLGVHDAFVAKYIDGTRVFEWNENPKYKGKKVPTSLEDALQSAPPAKKKKGSNN